MLFPTSSTSSVTSSSDFNVAHISNVHVKKTDVLRTPKEPRQKGGKEMKQHRYAFQTRSQIDILDDGYRWRKYGEKAVKNNRFRRLVSLHQ